MDERRFGNALCDAWREGAAVSEFTRQDFFDDCCVVTMRLRLDYDPEPRAGGPTLDEAEYQANRARLQAALKEYLGPIRDPNRKGSSGPT